METCLPIAGEIAAVNEALGAGPDAINSDPFGAGWIVKFHPTNPADWETLMTPEAYERTLGG